MAEASPAQASRPDCSLIVPLFDEEENLLPLLEEIAGALADSGYRYEVVLVDDGSRDRSPKLLLEAARRDPSLCVVLLRKNFGQTAALQAGIDQARGEFLVLLDADLQNDPRDIPIMIELLRAGHDLVAGWRAERKDSLLARRLPSFLANRLISYTTGVRLHDYGCTLKAMRREIACELRLYGEMHRFIPAMASWVGAKLIEVKVNHRPRRFGRSKYGLGRTMRVVLDLITVRFVQSYLTRPMHVFGFTGLACFAVGFLLCAWLAFSRLVWGNPLADRPALLLGVLLVVVGVQLVSLGLVSDTLSRTYFESQGKRPYFVRTIVRGWESLPPPPNHG